MKLLSTVRMMSAAMALGLCLTLAGCGQKVEGKYANPSGIGYIEFKDGKATVKLGGTSLAAEDYTVSGDTVTIKKGAPDGGDLNLKIQSDGSLDAGNGMKLTKMKD